MVGHTGVFIGLGENPDDDESAFNVDAIRFCEDKKKELLTLLNESYKLMLQYYENYKEVFNAAGENRGDWGDGAL